MANDALRMALEDILKKHNGLTPRIVVAEARDPKHPLHERFEWDDSVAAEKYRERQASELIRSVRVNYIRGDGSRSSVRAFHSVPTETRRTYLSVGEVLEDPLKKQMLVNEARRDWIALKKRWENLVEFFEFVRDDLDI